MKNDQEETEIHSLQVKVDQLTNQNQSWMQELKRRNLENDLVNRMDFALQQCQSIEDIQNQLGQFVYRLFLEQPGELFLVNEDKQVMEKSITWGQVHRDPTILRKEYCTSLQLGQTNLFQENTQSSCLYHQTLSEEKDHNSAYICSPLMNKETIIGLLHQHIIETSAPLQEIKWLSDEHWKQLAVSVCNRLASSLIAIKNQHKKKPQITRDPLTHLLNRWYMEETLERELHFARRHKIPLWVYSLDMDQMKKLNEHRGFNTGDEVLKNIGAFLQNHVRAEDVICRSGGDEFVMVLLGIPDEIAVQRAQKLCQGIQEFNYEKSELIPEGTTCSFGIAGFPNNGDNSSDLLRAANRALHRAKVEGRNQVQVAL